MISIKELEKEDVILIRSSDELSWALETLDNEFQIVYNPTTSYCVGLYLRPVTATKGLITESLNQPMINRIFTFSEIIEFNKGKEFKPGDFVSAWDIKEELCTESVIFIHYNPRAEQPYLVMDEKDYNSWNKHSFEVFETSSYKHIKPFYPKDMTKEEIEKELGYKINIV